MSFDEPTEGSNERGNGFLSSTDLPLGEETKNGSNGDALSEGNDAASFSFTTTKGTKIEVQTLGDILASVPEGGRRWTVDGLLPECGLGVLGGRHKGGKSTLAIHLARSVEAGAPFLDRITRQAPVVYVNYEMPLDYFASLSNLEPIPKNFYVINRPELQLKPATVEAVIREMKKRGFDNGMVVIDSFRGAFKLTGEQENQAGQAGTLLRLLQEIGVKTGWLIVVIHHHKKASEAHGADNLSGTGDFGAASDVIWTWFRLDPSKPGVLEIEGRLEPVEPLRVRLSPEDCVYLGSARGGAEDDEKQRIEQALGTNRLSGREIASKTGIPYATVMKRLNSMKNEVRVDSQIGSGSGSPHIWFRLDSEDIMEMALAEATKQE